MMPDAEDTGEEVIFKNGMTVLASSDGTAATITMKDGRKTRVHFLPDGSFRMKIHKAAPMLVKSLHMHGRGKDVSIIFIPHP